MARAKNVLPIMAACAGIAVFCVMDAFMKRASIAGGVYSAMVLRNCLAAMMMLPLWWAAGGKLPRQAVLKLHVIRSATVALMAPLWFWGLVRLPMAEAMAISFIAPLIALYLAAVLLGERIRAPAILASMLGFAGVAVIAAGRMGEGSYDAEAGYGIAAILASALLYAWNLILQRQQAQLASPQEIALFQNTLVALFFLPFAPWLGHWPEAAALLDIAGAAVTATAALLLLSWAYARAQAQVLVPVEYTGFIWTALLGWWWFGEAVTGPTIAGAFLIVAACLIAARGHSGGSRTDP
jgi:S-adenosylmethionine uptake transporter